jgi:hypothetical protein
MTEKILVLNLKVMKPVADPGIHFTRGVNKIIKYNDKIFFYIIFLL